MRFWKRWELRFWHDWEPFYNWKSHWNWIDFTFVNFTVEYADYDSPRKWEINVALLGFHVELVYLDLKKVEMWQKHIDSFGKGGEGEGRL